MHSDGSNGPFGDPSPNRNSDDSRLKNLVRKTSFGAFLLYVGAFLALVGVGGAAVQAFGHHVGVFMYQFIAIFGSAVVFRRLAGEAAWDWPQLRGLGVRPWAFVTIAVTIVLLGLVGNIGMGLMVEYVPGLEQNAAEYSRRMRRLLLEAEGIQWWLGMLSVCVTAPLAEEALFRGTILQEQRKSSLGLWSLALANGALFALFHIYPLVMPSLLLLGTFLAYITLISESLLLPIVAHALVNTFNGLVLPRFLSSSGPEALKGEAATAAGLWVWLGVLGAAAAVGWTLTHKLRPGADSN